MPYSYDLFVAALTCPHCGETSPADDSTNMQTYVRDRAQANREFLAPGTPLPLDSRRILARDYDGYLPVGVPAPGEPTRILHTWECPSCGYGFNWAEVVVRDGVIERIDAVPFDREHFERSHLLSIEAMSVAVGLTGKPPNEISYQDLVQLLRELL
ncbi:hypothetical protein HPC49_24825 [Pyxidicoccus fallax]|uniref:Uncharacterized protein n=1 Tax=Pyxidicoccus fallax TaxID=394095 RepID=A0A848LF72_9BACT|nr:hypothetical protein [Pyxidicoccus fallax]NMO16942.1 hypothetical protein [Pyxidicoccus fallax]NPC81440.1 hypothetical protein [Pyxidicoccus fallax]